MNSLRRNAAANFLGTAFVAGVYFLVLPVYLYLLGPDKFGLVGLFFALSGIAAALDLGMGAALNRLLAQRSASKSDNASMRDAVYTFGFIVVVASLLVGLLLTVWLPSAASHWLKTGSLDTNVVKSSIQYMGIGLAVQMILSLYTNALWGLQKQIAYNCVNSLMMSTRLLGGAMLLWLIGPDIVIFFAWNAALLLIHAVVLFVLTWQYLPNGRAAIFSLRFLYESKNFIIDMAIATILSSMLLHIDKLILAQLFSLKDFGYYMLAWSIASLLNRIAVPVYSAWMPKLSQQVAIADSLLLAQTYYSGFRLMCWLLLPIALTIAIFSYPILYFYTRNLELAQSGYIALSLLAIGSACNGLLLMPHSLAVAHGWSRLPLMQNLLTCFLALPAIYWFAHRWGLQGAGLGWMLVNIALLMWTLPLVSRTCLTVPRRKLVELFQ
jgi:O-antigen/teichoic acid export membrane protein